MLGTTIRVENRVAAEPGHATCRSSRIGRLAVLALALALGPTTGTGTASAQPAVSSKTATAPTANAAAALTAPAFRDWLSAFRPEALAFGIAPATFDTALAAVTPDLDLPDLIMPGQTTGSERGQAEFIRHPKDYLDAKLLARLAERGRAMAKLHAAVLAQIEREIGVEARFVLAIWGRETDFGRHKSKHDAIRVLATQAWRGRRKELFRKELLYALKMLDDGIRTRDGLRSSWAGAMGLTQFMPSEYWQHGHDLDKDGRIDIWSSVGDALASAAKQLAGKGWVRGTTWGREVRLAKAGDCVEEGPDRMRPLSEWRRRGLTLAGRGGKPLPDSAERAYLMAPIGTHGPLFLVSENFLVVKRYNMSDLYATFVGNLADRIAGGGGFAVQWAKVAMPKTSDIIDVQAGLKRAGRAIEKIDGKIGSNTRHQVGMHQLANGMVVDCWPSAALARSLTR